MAQISIGLRDTRFAYISYTLDHRYEFKLENSLYSAQLAFQYARATAGYLGKIGEDADYGISAYYGSAWNNDYRNAGLYAALEYRIERVGVYGVINPHYDSTLDFDLCYRIGALCRLTDEIAVKCDYNTVPVYRAPEKRVRLGLSFDVGNLSVEPHVSLSVEKNDRFKSMRVLTSFKYTFGGAN